MLNPYEPNLAKIIKIKEETERVYPVKFAPQLFNGVKLFRLKFKDKKIQSCFRFSPGQFVELSIPGFGEAPLAPCSDPFEEKFFELCVRKTGVLTEKLHTLKVGDVVGIRGPYGRGWPVATAGIKNKNSRLRRGFGGQAKFKNKNLLLVAGGLGLIPLRPLILAKEKLFGKDIKIQIFCGARTPNDFLFQDEYEAWKKVADMNLTIDNDCEGWSGCVGLVTTLFDKVKLLENARAFLCGPPIMYKFVLEKLKERGFQDEDIFMALERRMHCAAGICQHCAIGPRYVCRDGPVFRYSGLKDIPDAV